MKRKRLLPLALLLGVVTQAAGLGCSSSPSSRFYMLRAAPESAGEAHPAAVNGIVVGVGPVRIADYLDRQRIVIRTTPSELSLSEYDRWAGSLEENVSDVVAQNLSRLLSTGQVFVYPWPSSVLLDYRVRLDIVELDGKPGGDVTLRASWTVAREGERGELTARASRITEKAAGSGYDSLVEAMSRSLFSLSREIASEIERSAGEDRRADPGAGVPGPAP